MKFLINGLFVITAAVIFSSTPSYSSDEFPTLRVKAVDASNYRDEYSVALQSDPYEGFNRSIFSFNKTIDDYFLEPVARFYKSNLPEWGRDRVSDFFNNISEINNFANSILQGDVESSFRSFFRFMVNSTFGIGGFHDVAGGFGLKEKDKSFSQTLSYYGVGAGNYIVLPLFGPSTSRDFAGTVFSRAADPATYVSSGYLGGGLGFVELVNDRSNILNLTDEIEFTSFDPYSSYKSSYLQFRRKSLIKTIE